MKYPLLLVALGSVLVVGSVGAVSVAAFASGAPHDDMKMVTAKSLSIPADYQPVRKPPAVDDAPGVTVVGVAAPVDAAPAAPARDAVPAEPVTRSVPTTSASVDAARHAPSSGPASHGPAEVRSRPDAPTNPDTNGEGLPGKGNAGNGKAGNNKVGNGKGNQSQNGNGTGEGNGGPAVAGG